MFNNSITTSTTDFDFNGVVANLGGKWLDTTGGTYNGALAELIFVDGVMSTFDRQKMEGYLAWKWGLEGSLPSGHPYEFSPPLA